MNEHITKIKKIYALAMQGVDGEKEQAAELLKKLTEKYNVSIDEIDEEETKDFDFTYHGEHEKRILLQTVYKVTNNPRNFHHLYYTGSGRKCRTQAQVTCTEAQKIEISFLFDFYKELFKKEQEIFFKAFIQKHRIFGNETDDKSEKRELTDEERDELNRMFEMMNGLSSETPTLRIEGGK